MSLMGTDKQAAGPPEESAYGQSEHGQTNSARNEHIREIAYYLWLDEGCPDGGAERHWTAAEAVLESEQRKRIEGEPPGEPVTEGPPALEVRRPRRAS